MITIKGYEGQLIVHLKERDLTYDIFFVDNKMLLDKTHETLQELDEEQIVGYELKVSIER